MHIVPYESDAEADRLIVEAASGERRLSADQLRRVLQHVARAGFDSQARERVRGRLAGTVWKERSSMAPSAKMAERLQLAINSIHLMLADLPEVAADWPSMSDAERVSWAGDWDQCMMSDLPLLDRHFRANRMAAGQAEAYQELQQALRKALPTIAELNLSRPSIVRDSAA